MSLCPICGEFLPITDNSNTRCASCQKDFEKGDWMFEMPEGLDGGVPKNYCDYEKIGRVMRKLREDSSYTVDDFYKEMAATVQEINITNRSAANRVLTEEERKTRELAGKLYRR